MGVKRNVLAPFTATSSLYYTIVAFVKKQVEHTDSSRKIASMKIYSLLNHNYFSKTTLLSREIRNFAPMNDFKNITAAQLLDIILQGNEQSDEAMYYVLKERVRERLKEKFKAHERVFFEEFEDVVDDFFLYLREGNGRKLEPYHALRSIVNKDAFEGWLVNTFRNYLTNRGNAEVECYALNEAQMAPSESANASQEELIHKAAQLIAYSHQVFLPRGRFIFLRSLLTILNKANALPDDEMAVALGMSHTHYRVTAHRMKKNVLKFRLRIDSGEHLRLDDDHKVMAARIDDDFCSLYPTLINYYNSTLQQLKQEPAITALREKHYNLTGLMLHECEKEYRKLKVNAFWNKLNRWLAR